MLERFFALYCTINSFTRLHVRTVQRHDEEVLAWPARSGQSLVI
ncbi:MAG: type VI secretion system baseplate subunit TssF [Azoarcus sp.]|nr:type VI secretion system baseplate subunit TssF [Azoarcus sp.]